MALSSAIINKADYLQRKSNLELRQMQLGDLVQRKLDQIKIIQSDTKRVNSAQKAWDSAVKTDLEKDKNNGVTAKRTDVINSADWKFAVSCGVKDGDATVYKVDDISVTCTKSFGNPYSEADNGFLERLQSESSQLELEKESIDSQLSQIEATLKGMDQLEQSAAQDNTLWAIGGG